MKLCIIGTGASGWMAANYFAKRDWVTDIHIIGSSAIPSIGVGESTTGRFDDFLECIDGDASEFIRESDAAVKYGVVYEDWSEKPFLHALRTNSAFERSGWDRQQWGRLLGAKPKEHHLHDYLDPELWRFSIHHQVSTEAFNIINRMRYKWEPVPNPPCEYENAWHFEANKFIGYMKKLASRSPKITLQDARVVDCERANGVIQHLVLEGGQRVTADYYIVSTGDTALNESVFDADYESLGDVLLTDRALFTPLEYEDRREQMHPFTVARAMPHGWRWITPTWSRIGTGYAFSSKHISDDQAVAEFRASVGKAVDPFVVDFKPRKMRTPFRNNYCFLGMAAGFLEPLDAPGLDIVVNYITEIDNHLSKSEPARAQDFPAINDRAQYQSEWFSAFILSQYKTSNRNDTDFWRDQKSVKCAWYDDIINNIDNLDRLHKNNNMMFYSTVAGKDHQWNLSQDLADQQLTPIRERVLPTLHHVDFLEQMRENPLVTI